LKGGRERIGRRREKGVGEEGKGDTI